LDGTRSSQKDWRSPPPPIRIHAKDDRSDGPYVTHPLGSTMSTEMTIHIFENYIWILGLKDLGEDLDRHRAEAAGLSDLAPIWRRFVLLYFVAILIR